MVENTTELADIKKRGRILLLGNSKFKNIDRTENSLEKYHLSTYEK